MPSIHPHWFRELKLLAWIGVFISLEAHSEIDFLKCLGMLKAQPGTAAALVHSYNRLLTKDAMLALDPESDGKFVEILNFYHANLDGQGKLKVSPGFTQELDKLNLSAIEELLSKAGLKKHEDYNWYHLKDMFAHIRHFRVYTAIVYILKNRPDLLKIFSENMVFMKNNFISGDRDVFRKDYWEPMVDGVLDWNAQLGKSFEFPGRKGFERIIEFLSRKTADFFESKRFKSNRSWHRIQQINSERDELIRKRKVLQDASSQIMMKDGPWDEIPRMLKEWEEIDEFLKELDLEKKKLLKEMDEP